MPDKVVPASTLWGRSASDLVVAILPLFWGGDRPPDAPHFLAFDGVSWQSEDTGLAQGSPQINRLTVSDLWAATDGPYFALGRYTDSSFRSFGVIARRQP